MPTTNDQSTALPGAQERPVQAPGAYALPSHKALALLVAAVFAIGLTAGAALGPAPSSSLADNSSIVQRVIALLAAQAIDGASSVPVTNTSAAKTASLNAEAHPSAAPHIQANHNTNATHSSSSTNDAPPSSTSGARLTPSSPASPTSGASEGEKAGKPARLPPIQHVWSIELAGSTFAAAETTPGDYPYLVGQLIPRGTLLTSYTALDAYELAGDATLLPGGVGAVLNTISEPACGATAASQPDPGCPAGSQPSAAEADAFLQRVLAPILASPSYGENGLIVISFAAVSNENSATTTYSLQPTAGALLLSPLLHGGARSTSPFNSLSPRASVAAIFAH